MIIFLRIIILSFQSHQTHILSASLGMAWNWYGLSCKKKKVYLVAGMPVPGSLGDKRPEVCRTNVGYGCRESYNQHKCIKEKQLS